jgi:hypothetical protein
MLQPVEQEAYGTLAYGRTIHMGQITLVAGELMDSKGEAACVKKMQKELETQLKEVMKALKKEAARQAREGGGEGGGRHKAVKSQATLLREAQEKDRQEAEQSAAEAAEAAEGKDGKNGEEGEQEGSTVDAKAPDDSTAGDDGQANDGQANDGETEDPALAEAVSEDDAVGSLEEVSNDREEMPRIARVVLMEGTETRRSDGVVLRFLGNGPDAETQTRYAYIEMETAADATRAMSLLRQAPDSENNLTAGGARIEFQIEDVRRAGEEKRLRERVAVLREWKGRTDGRIDNLVLQQQLEDEVSASCERRLAVVDGELEHEKKRWETICGIIHVAEQVREKIEEEEEKQTACLKELATQKKDQRERLAAAATCVGASTNPIDRAYRERDLERVKGEVVEKIIWVDARREEEVRDRRRHIEERHLAAVQELSVWIAETESVDERWAVVTPLLASHAKEEAAAARHVVFYLALADALAKDEKVKLPPGMRGASDVEAAKAEADEASRTSAELHARRLTAKAREFSWLSDSLGRCEEMAGKWIGEQERRRHRRDVEVRDRGKAAAQLRHAEIEEAARRRNEHLHEYLAQIRVNAASTVRMYARELGSVRRTGQKSTTMLQSRAVALKKKFMRYKRDAEKKLKSTVSMFEAEVKDLTEQLVEALDVGQRRWLWVQTLRSALVTAEEDKLVKEQEFKDAQLAWERVRQKLAAELKHWRNLADRRQQWVHALQDEVAARHREIAHLEADKDTLKREHAKVVRDLKWQVWKRDETARRLRTNADAAFLWFAEVMSSLAGASRTFNQRIAANGGIGCLVALAQSDRMPLKRHAAKALGTLAWDGFTDFRVVSRRARDAWERWMDAVALEEEWRWRLPAEELERIAREEAQVRKSVRRRCILE